MMHAATIVARNYLAQARVLVDSFREHHPDGTFDILLIDEPGTPRPQVDGADVLMIDEIGIDPGVLARMTVAYQLIELATAVKPWLLESLLERGYDHAVYFDPDILIAREIAELPDLARSHSIVLTPHVTEPMPRDGHLPDEQTLLLAGIYNLGFIAVGASPEARRFLTWWQQRLRTDSYDKKSKGFFTDQRWIDFVPSLFEHHLVKDPSWNVAYWNLPTRPLSESPDGGLLVSGRPLTFAHLSGYSPRVPHLLSKHQGDDPRLLLSEDPLLTRLCEDYGRRLLDAGFEARVSGFQMPFVERDGVQLDTIVRKLVRQELADELVGKGTGLGWPDAPGESLDAWLHEPRVEDHTTLPNLGRYLSAVYRSRPDVQAAFPEAVQGDLKGFLRWVRIFGKSEEGVPEDVTARALQHWEVLEAETASAGDLVPGVEVVGYLTADLGLGETARQFVVSLESAGVPLSTRTFTRTSSRQAAPWTDRPAPAGIRYDTLLTCVNADMTPTLAADMRPEFYEGRYTIGLWFWELNRWPKDMTLPALEHVDEVWVCSDYNAESLRRLTDKPVTVVPHPAHAPQQSDVRIPEIADGVFTFLFVFDYFSSVERKNPVGLIEAFVKAFPEPGEARLVIKSINGHKRTADRERVRYAAAGRPDIVLIERYLSREELDGLMWNADCYVSLHRSEGFGQTLAETMAIGKPVIATRYSGNLMFMNEKNSILIGQKRVPVPAGSGVYPQRHGLGWADPLLGQAAKAMRRIFEKPELRRRLGERAKADIARTNSQEALARAAVTRLEEIRLERAADSPLKAAARWTRERLLKRSEKPSGDLADAT